MVKPWCLSNLKINISLGKINKRKILGLYSPSGVFELKKIFAERHEEMDPCCEDKFADVTYYLLIWRRPKFFLFNYIQPAVLINILALWVSVKYCLMLYINPSVYSKEQSRSVDTIWMRLSFKQIAWVFREEERVFEVFCTSKWNSKHKRFAKARKSSFKSLLFFPLISAEFIFRFVFLIPAESGEKITLGISTMLNMTVFLMTVMQGLPATDQTPIISRS